MKSREILEEVPGYKALLLSSRRGALFSTSVEVKRPVREDWPTNDSAAIVYLFPGTPVNSPTASAFLTPARRSSLVVVSHQPWEITAGGWEQVPALARPITFPQLARICVYDLARLA